MPPMGGLRFADGGVVTTPVGTSTCVPSILQIGSEMFAGMLAPEDVAQNLLRVAVTWQVRSTGRKPSHYPLVLTVIGIADYSARDLTQTQNPFEPAASLRRTMTGSLRDFSFAQFRNISRPSLAATR